ncbi:hypothetical protein ACE6H2_010912 [Prunus campanulata]
MRLHGQKRKTHDQGCGRDLPGFMGSHHHASRSQMSIGLPTCSDQAPPRRFSASITHLRTLPINTRLKLHSKGAGAPSLLISRSPHISYDRRFLSNAPEHRPKPTTNTITNGLVAQAVNLTAEISSSLGYNRLIRSQTQTGAPLNHFTHINTSTHSRPCWHASAQPHRTQKKDATC